MFKRVALVVFLIVGVGLGIFAVTQLTKVNHSELGYKLWREGNNQQAIAEFTLDIRDNPNNVQSYVNRAAVFQRLGMDDEAIADLTSAISVDISHSFSYGMRAEIYAKQKKWELAWKDYDRQVKLEQSTCFGLVGRGYSYWQLGYLKEALSDLETYVLRRERCIDKYSVDQVNLDITKLKKQLGIGN